MKYFFLNFTGPGFEKENTLTKILSWLTFRQTDFQMISRDDADYVQIIHTNAGKYGIVSSRGHADFYPNAGYKQSGCELELIADDVCSHRRAWVFYQESVYPRKPFLAVKCDSFDDFKEGKCKNNQITKMGLSGERDEGNFYLITHSNPLYTALGEDGIEFNGFDIITDDGTTKKPLVMHDPIPEEKPKWENTIEFEKLLIVTENGEVERDFVKLSSPLEVMENDFELVSDSSGSIKSSGGFLLILSFLYIKHF